MALVYSKQLPLGWIAKDFRLEATDGYEYALRAFSDKNGLCIVFTCNHCPYAKAAWPILVRLNREYQKDIGFVAINSNNPASHPEDSFDKMVKLAKKLNLAFPYLHDSTQQIARDYLVQCTPDPYLFKYKKGKFMLFYHGRITDNWKYPRRVKERNLEDAIKALIKEEEPPKEQPPSMGCSIKGK